MKALIFKEKEKIGEVTIDQQGNLNLDGNADFEILLNSLLYSSRETSNIEFIKSLPRRLKSYIYATIENNTSL